MNEHVQSTATARSLIDIVTSLIIATHHLLYR